MATRVQFDHLAPVGIGNVVLAEATLVKVEGRRLTFTVSAARLERDGGGLVGAGRVTRVVVDEATFLAKAGATGEVLIDAHRAGPPPDRTVRAAGRARPPGSTPGRGPAHGSAGTGPVIAAFVTFGLFWGSWAVMVFDIQRTFALSDAQLGVLLALAIALAGASSAVMGHLADRVGARRMLWIALWAWSGLLVVMSAAQQKWAFVGCAGAGRDRRGQHRHRHERRGDPSPEWPTRRRSSVSTLCSTGAPAAAAAAGLVIHAGISWRWVWPGVAWSALAVGLWTLSLGPEAAPGARRPAARAAAQGCTGAPNPGDGLLLLLRCSPWPRSPRVASTPGVSSTCAIIWPPASCSGQAPTSWARSWPPPHGARRHVVGRLSARQSS